MAVAERRDRREGGGEGEEVFDRWLRNVFFTHSFPPSMEVLYEVVDGDVRAYIWRWSYGGRTVYGLNVSVCDNNVLSMRSFSEDSVNHWLVMLSDIINLMKQASTECIYSH